MNRISPALGVLLLAASSLAADPREDALRAAFVGRPVAVKIDLPASHKGVDLRFDLPEPFDPAENASRIRQYDLGIAQGQRVPITYIKVKDDLIEFHLAGGGFNWITQTTTWTFTPESKSNRERDLDHEIKHEKDRDRKRRLEDERDELRRRRERHDDRRRHEVEEHNEWARQKDHDQALRQGSRINVRFKKVVPPDALTPEGLRRYLEPWIDFDPSEQPDRREGRADGREGRDSGDEPAGLRKGMSRREVDELLGKARRQAACQGGELNCVVAIYDGDDGPQELTFVADVLIRIGPAR